MRKKDLEEKVKKLQEFIYENNFFLRYLIVDLEKYQENPVTAVHDQSCTLNDLEIFETYKIYNKVTREWEHNPDYVNQLCDCKVRAVINTIYEIKQYQKDKNYQKLINDIKKSKEKEQIKKTEVKINTSNLITKEKSINV